MKGRIYLSGPMSGKRGLNMPAFHAEAKRLRDAGFEVENPAEINPDPAANWNDCLRADIARLVTCDAVCALPGWQESRGARLELHIAQALAMMVFEVVPEHEMELGA